MTLGHNMRRKVLQDFAHVCCQKFLTSLSNSDRINFAIFGSGRISIDFLSQRCTYDGIGLSTLGYCASFRLWLSENCLKHNIRLEDFVEARLEIQMDVKTERKERSGYGGWLTTRMVFDCESRIATDEKIYTARMSDSQHMGLGQILIDRYY